MTLNDLIQLGSILVAGGAVYGGIRADLKAMHGRIDEVAETSKHAHFRLDGLMDRRQFDGH